MVPAPADAASRRELVVTIVDMRRFSDDVVHAVLRHMNDDHGDDSLAIVRAFAEPDATSATMTGLDGAGGDWLAAVRDGEVPVRVAWPFPVSERPDIRRAVVELYDEACERLGMPRRERH